MNDHKNVMVFAEITEGNLGAITKELLGGGKKLADYLGEELYAVLIGSNISDLASEAIAFGANKVFVVDHPLLKLYHTDPYILSMVKAIEKAMPRIIILGNTEVGQDLGPRLAFRLHTTIVTDCVELSIDPDTRLLIQTKPVYGEKAMACFASESCPQMATVRPKSMPPLERDDSRQGETIPIDADLDKSPLRAKVLERVQEQIEGVKLEDAEVIVTGGRGMGSLEDFKRLEETARILKGAVGATRAACDAEWAPTTIQVGLTGKIVAPRLYIAVALSGASQHIAGCSRSQTIVAINKNPSAPIFKEAKFGVVGDWKVTLPAFTKKIKELS